MDNSLIEQLKKDLLDLGWRIRVCDKLIVKITDLDLRDFYNKQLLDLIEDYYKLEEVLKKEINTHISNEDNVIDFNMRKLKKSITE